MLPYLSHDVIKMGPFGPHFDLDRVRLDDTIIGRWLRCPLQKGQAVIKAVGDSANCCYQIGGPNALSTATLFCGETPTRATLLWRTTMCCHAMYTLASLAMCSLRLQKDTPTPGFERGPSNGARRCEPATDQKKSQAQHEHPDARRPAYVRLREG